MSGSVRYHLALFESALVVLDVKKGRYLLYDKGVATDLSEFIDENISGEGRRFPQVLFDDGIIPDVNIDLNESIHDHRLLRYDNFGSDAWSARRLSGRVESGPGLYFWSKLVWNAILLKTIGFRALQKLERRIHRKAASCEFDVGTLCIPEKFLRAALWSPLSITCLQMSFAISDEFRRRGIDSALVIGVRVLPFVAHAWVEVGGIVQGDETNTSITYGEIYRVPKVK